MPHKITLLEGGIYNKGERYSRERRYIAIGEGGIWRKPKPGTERKPRDIVEQHQAQDGVYRFLLLHHWKLTHTQRVFYNHRLVTMARDHKWFPARYNYWKLEYWVFDPEAARRHNERTKAKAAAKANRDAARAKAA